MDRLVGTVVGMLDELRLDLQDFAWLICQQLNLDSFIIRASDHIVLVFTRVHRGRQRSLVRQIGYRLPLKPLPRVHFTIVSTEDDWDSGSTTVDGGLAAIPTLDSDGKIDFWAKKMKHKASSSLAESEIVAEDEDEARSLRSASPVCADSLYSSQSTVDTVAMNKISALEDELAKLRDQIAKIVIGATVTNTGSSDYGSMPATPVPPPPPPPPPPLPMSMCMPPPPPPPPPPLSLSDACQTPTRKLSLAESLQSKSLKAVDKSAESRSLARTSSVPSMADVLKDMGKVKLKKVDRSVNGTPVRDKNRELKNDDPATMIALALRKRFAQMNQINDSPEREREDREDPEDSFSETTEHSFGTHTTTPKLATPASKSVKGPPSPRKLFVLNRPNSVSPLLAEAADGGTAIPFGQHLLRKTGQRS